MPLAEGSVAPDLIFYVCGAIIGACFYTLACVATQSRTALLGMTVAIIILIVGVRTIQRSIAVVMIVAVPVIVVVMVLVRMIPMIMRMHRALWEFRVRGVATSVVAKAIAARNRCSAAGTSSRAEAIGPKNSGL